MSETYTDFLIHIRQWLAEAAAYPVEVTLGDGSFFFGYLNLDEARLLQADIEPAEYGRQLYRALFAGPIGHAYERAVGMAAQHSDGQLRVRLWLDSQAAHLHPLKWERLYQLHHDGEIPLSITTKTPFSRYTGLGIAEPQPVDERPIRLLFAVANPANLESDYQLAPIEVEREVETLRLTLGNLHRQKLVEVTLLPGCSGLPADLQQKLKEEGYQTAEGPTSLANLLRLLPHFHVLHFLGHGDFRRQRGEDTAFLYLESEDGRAEAVEDTSLATGLRALARQPQLIFLAACETGQRDPAFPFVGMAPRLVRAGVPAVVAMQEVIEMKSARQLTRDFYSNLMQHGLVDRALNEARGLLYRRKDNNWAVPVLFMRLRSGRLFAPDPVQAALEAMARSRALAIFNPSHAQYISLPIEVTHLTGAQDYTNLDRFGQEMTARIDILRAVEESFSGRENEDDSPRLVVLMGGFGSNKSTQLKRIFWHTVQAGLNDRLVRRIPVYLNLQQFRPTGSAQENGIEKLALESLRSFWPELTASTLEALPSGLILRFLIDGLEELAEKDRPMALSCLEYLISDYRHCKYEYLMAGGPTSIPWQQTATRFMERNIELNLLLIQPLNHTKIRHFLNNLETTHGLQKTTPDGRRKLGQALLDKLHQSQLIDLAATPSFMVELLQKAARGNYPKSRTDALYRMLQDTLLNVAPGQGMRAFATETIYALALAMHASGRTVFPLGEAFSIINAVRGSRGYDPEVLYNQFLEQNVLIQVGDDCLRFAYPPIQAYCSAQAVLRHSERLRLIDDMLVTLNTPSRLHWWEETLICLSGLLAQRGELQTLQQLLTSLIYGVELLRGEQLFLAARCLLECRLVQNDALAELRKHVVTALQWRTGSRNEPQSPYRALAAELLSRLADPAVAVDLGRLVYEKVRRNLRDVEDYEFSSVRMAAAIALRRVPPEETRKSLQAIHPELEALFQEWQRGAVEALVRRFTKSDDAGLQAVAALALGDLADQATLSPSQRAGDIARNCLIKAFSDPAAGLLPSVRWAVADALAMLDPIVITQEVIGPALQRVNERGDDQSRCIEQDKSLAYLIGLVRSTDPRAHDFLLNTCLKSSADMRLWLSAIDALIRLGNQDDRRHFEDIAANTFGEKALDRCFSNSAECYLIRRKAIEALANLGNIESIAYLRSKGIDRDAELHRAFYETAQAIYWRLR